MSTRPVTEIEAQQGHGMAAINTALKTLCREFGVERDRRSVLQIATLLMRLSKEGTVQAEDLVRLVREQLTAGLNASPKNQFESLGAAYKQDADPAKDENKTLEEPGKGSPAAD